MVIEECKVKSFFLAMFIVRVGKINKKIGTHKTHVMDRQTDRQTFWRPFFECPKDHTNDEKAQKN